MSVEGIEVFLLELEILAKYRCRSHRYLDTL